jgi:hypothetical protein
VRERLAAARKMAETIRAALPGGSRREPTPPPVERRSRRPRDPGELPVASAAAPAKGPAAAPPPITVEYLRGLLAMASGSTVLLPETEQLSSYITRLDAFQVPWAPPPFLLPVTAFAR